jgi:hypothetical protein
MKKLFLSAFLFTALAAASLFAWDSEDLKKYPGSLKAGDLHLNIGAGFEWVEGLGSDYIYIPPIRASLDYNIPLGEEQLPFFFGGAVGYSGYGHKDPNWYYNKLYIASRFGYHFNWDIDKLDHYALITGGWRVDFGDTAYASTAYGWPILDLRIGARWFLLESFGFWAETAFGTSIFSLDLGLTFKF